MYMFSGTFFALGQLPHGVRLVASALPLAQGVALCRSLSLGHRVACRASRRGPRYLLAFVVGGHRRGADHLPEAAARVIATGWTLRRTGSLVERNALIYRRSLTPVLSSIVEPVLYLLSIGFGVGTLVGKVAGVDVRYAAFVAPGDPGHHRDERGLQPDELRRLLADQDGADLRRDRADAALGRRHRAR